MVFGGTGKKTGSRFPLMEISHVNGKDTLKATVWDRAESTAHAAKVCVVLCVVISGHFAPLAKSVRRKLDILAEAFRFA